MSDTLESLRRELVGVPGTVFWCDGSHPTGKGQHCVCTSFSWLAWANRALAALERAEQKVAEYESCLDMHDHEKCQRIEQLEAALRFYADPKSYNGPNQRVEDGEDRGGGYRLDVTTDRGNKARAALEEKP